MAQTIYRAVVQGNVLATSKNAGTPSVKVTVRTKFVVGTNQPADLTLAGDIWLTEKAIERALKTLSHVFGWNGKSLQELNSPVLVGVECEIVVGQEEYEGKMYDRIQYFNRPGESQVITADPLKDDQARNVASKFDDALRRFQRATPPSTSAPRVTAPQPATVPPEENPNDLPF